MDQCPKCHRKLLSHASPRCSWCGEEIADPDYQEQAEAEREAFFAHIRVSEALSLARLDAIDMHHARPQDNPWLGRSVFNPLPGAIEARKAQRRLNESVRELAPTPLPSKARVEANENQVSHSETNASDETSQANVNAGFQDLPETSADVIKGRFRDLD